MIWMKCARMSLENENTKIFFFCIENVLLESLLSCVWRVTKSVEGELKVLLDKVMRWAAGDFHEECSVRASKATALALVAGLISKRIKLNHHRKLLKLLTTVVGDLFTFRRAQGCSALHVSSSWRSCYALQTIPRDLSACKSNKLRLIKSLVVSFEIKVEKAFDISLKSVIISPEEWMFTGLKVY